MGTVRISSSAIFQKKSAETKCPPSLPPFSYSPSAPPSPLLPLESALAHVHLSEEWQTLTYLPIWASGTNTQTCLRSIRTFLQLEQNVCGQHTRRKEILLG